jgi:hypothetical protein
VAKGRKPRRGRLPSFLEEQGKGERVEAVLRCLPQGGGEVGSTELITKLKQAEGASRASAIRWLKEAETGVPLKVRIEGRRKYYSFRISGFMEEGEARWQVRSSYVGFLDQAPELWQEYAGSTEGLRLFWQQASSALLLGIEHLLESAQSVSFGNVDPRVNPSADIARRQADVFVEVFLRKWIAELVAAYHHFLEVEREMNKSVPRKADGTLGAPSARVGFMAGWRTLRSQADKQWIASRSKGPWAAWLKAKIAAEEARFSAIGSGSGAAEPSTSGEH